MRRRRREAGFSLAEILVSVVLVSFMGMMMYESMDQASRAKDETEAALDRMQSIRVALRRLTRDLSMAFLSKHKDPQMAEKPRTLFRGDRDKVAFTALSHARLYRDARESDQCEVSYWVRPSTKGGGYALFRRESRRIDEEPLRGGRSMTLLEGVDRFELDFWDGKNCTDDCWKDRWDTTQLDGQPNRLPSRVRIRLTARDEYGDPLKFETQVQLPMQDPFNF